MGWTRVLKNSKSREDASGAWAGRAAAAVRARRRSRIWAWYLSSRFYTLPAGRGSVCFDVGWCSGKKRGMGVTADIAGKGGTPAPTEKITEYFADLEQKGISINFGSYFSETQARVAVLGYEARQPTGEELARMEAIMETAMKAGAFGVTTALIYPPSSYATTAELIEVAKVAAKYRGIYARHIRGEGREVVESIDEAIAIGEKAGLPVEISHLKAAYQPGWSTLMREAGEHIEAEL